MRTALVGGGSKGLGFGCAQALAERGHRIVICARDAGALETAASALRSTSKSEIVTIACDWSKKDGLEFLGKELREKKIEIDILINNVGGPATGLVTETDEVAWEKGLDLLFRSTIRLYATLLPGMRQRGWGRIVNILSTTAVEPVPTLAVSSVLRAGLASYSKLTAWEVAKDGVTINSVMPGGVLTARTEQLMAERAKAQGVTLEVLRKESEEKLHSKRFLDPVDVGRVVAFLASDEARGITGALIPVEGGALASV